MTAKIAFLTILIILCPALIIAGNIENDKIKSPLKSTTIDQIPKTAQTTAKHFDPLQNDLFEESTPELKADFADFNLHPALGDNLGGDLLLGYEAYTDTTLASTMYFNGSDNDGLSWTSCCYIDLYGSTYPSMDFWGSASTFYATYIPPLSFQNGGSFMLMEFLDPTDPVTWDGVWASYASQGWHSMKMVDIASNNGQESWNWGVQSAILSRYYPEDPNFNLYDAPHIFYMLDYNTTYISYLDLDSCRTTAAYIDNAAQKIYAVYDRYDVADDQYQLVVRQDDFGDIGANTMVLEKNFTDLDQHIIYPVVAANNNKILVAAATYNDSLPGDKDIICFYTNDGDLNNLTNMSVISGSANPENYPEIAHVSGDTFYCTYIENDSLYVRKTTDAGASWSPAEMVNETNDETVIAEYRTADLAKSGSKVAYQYNPLGSSDILIKVVSIYDLDRDADGVPFINDDCPGDPENDPDADNVCSSFDNCPDTYNPSQSDIDEDGIGDECDNCMSWPNPGQIDSDGDEWGDVCDNCPDDPNSDQLDTDGDGIGNICDLCPNDFNNDIDNDGYCADNDNCPSVYNPDQTDTDSDNVGDLCDNCINDPNPDQADLDEDDIGDICDDCTDQDDDGYGDPGFPTNTCPDDNCPTVYNPDQTDSDSDGTGDACEFICGDINGDDLINLLDITYLINFLYNDGPFPVPTLEAGDINGDGDVNILDITYLINYLYNDGPAPSC